MRITEGHLRLSHKEIWNAGEHIAACIYDGILQFKNSERHSYPTDFITSREWDECLDKMLFSFKEISTNYKNDPWEIYFREELKKGLYKIKIDDYDRLEDFKIPCLDAVDDSCNTKRTEIEKKSKKYFESIKEGLDLFSKYYMDLWD